MLEGGIVYVHDDHRVFAKILAANGSSCEIEFFNSVSDRSRKTVDQDDITRLELQRETRVFLEDAPGFWRVGRVVSHLNEDDAATIYEVQFPNKDVREISEVDLYVRSLDTFSDPAEALASGFAETQYFADCRRDALNHLRNLRSACQGLYGVCSSAIELMPHQISNVRRVLQDHTLRYLLADEVGLGKTIEAGAIIRQKIMDRAETSVLVLTPPTLVSQWQKELATRFYLEDGSSNLRILPYEDALDLHFVPDILVVDEAHRVVAMPSGEADEVATRIQALAGKSDGLLLLSATPVLGDEQRLLALLNLLEPTLYPLNDVAGFKKKIEKRQEIGRLLLPLQPDADPFVVKTQAQSALEMFPDDQFIQDTCQEIVDAIEDEEKRTDLVVLIREYIARTYRIHDRLLRSRRLEAEAWAMRPRGAPYPQLGHVRYVFDQATWPQQYSLALEDWRLAARASEGSNSQELVDRWRQLVGASYLGQKSAKHIVGNLIPIFEGEEAHIEAFQSLFSTDVPDEARLEIIAEDLLEWRKQYDTSLATIRPVKAVCFATQPHEAVDLYGHLRSNFGQIDVLALTGDMDERARSKCLASFESDAQSWILVCDSSAEEGINLQFVDAIFHVDLPTSVARLEQRIGRLDRFGRKIPTVQHRIFLPDEDEDAPWFAWTDLLLNGFQIFNGSVSDVQFKLDEVEKSIWRELFEGETSDVEEIASRVEKEIAEERTKLNEQHTLDIIASLSENAEAIVEAMEDAEADETELNYSISRWLHGCLRINQSPPKPKPDETIRFFWDRPLIPDIPWKLVFDDAVDTPSTWRRTLAESGRNRPILLRPGSKLVDSLERLASWDDRGTAYATLRIDPSVSDEWMGFRWRWLLAPDLTTESAIWEELKRPDLARRAEGYLPIRTVEHWTDLDGNQLADQSLLEKLERRYEDKADDVRDINLGSRPKLFSGLVDQSVFADLVMDLRDKSLELAWNSDDVKAAVISAEQEFERDAALTTTSLEQRVKVLEAESGQVLARLNEDLEDFETLRAAIAGPSLRLEECGFMVISPEAPNAIGS